MIDINRVSLFSQLAGKQTEKKMVDDNATKMGPRADTENDVDWHAEFE